jgi:hypothetical protein
MKDFSVLDLPEPLRSQTLKSMNMTAEECAAHLDGLSAIAREMEQRPPSTSRIMRDDDSNAAMKVAD